MAIAPNQLLKSRLLALRFPTMDGGVEPIAAFIERIRQRFAHSADTAPRPAVARLRTIHDLTYASYLVAAAQGITVYEAAIAQLRAALPAIPPLPLDVFQLLPDAAPPAELPDAVFEALPTCLLVSYNYISVMDDVMATYENEGEISPDLQREWLSYLPAPPAATAHSHSSSHSSKSFLCG